MAGKKKTDRDRETETDQRQRDRARNRPVDSVENKALETARAADKIDRLVTSRTLIAPSPAQE